MAHQVTTTLRDRLSFPKAQQAACGGTPPAPVPSNGHGLGEPHPQNEKMQEFQKIFISNELFFLPFLLGISSSILVFDTVK